MSQTPDEPHVKDDPNSFVPDLTLPLNELSPKGFKGPKVIKNIHRSMVDTILAYPTVTTAELAEMYGFSRVWVNACLNSPLFIRLLEKRRAEVINPIIASTTEDRLKMVVNRSLDVIHEKLSKDANEVSDNLALKALEIGAKALGLGGNTETKVVIETDRLDNLAKRLVALRPRDTSQGVIYEAQAREVPDPGDRSQDPYDIEGSEPDED